MVLAFEESFFTNADGQPLLLDAQGNPKVDVVIKWSRTLVIATNPGQVLAWLRLTNTGDQSLDSFQIRETLPKDWLCDGCPDPDNGLFNVNVLFVSGGVTSTVDSNHYGIIADIANPTTIQLSIPDLAASSVGKSLGHGDSLLVSVTMTYGLKGTSQDAVTYPRTYTDIQSGLMWISNNYGGEHVDFTGSASFIAYAKVVGTGGGHGLLV